MFLYALKSVAPFMWKKATEEQKNIIKKVLLVLKDDESLVHAIVRATDPQFANEGFRHLLAQDKTVADMIAKCHTLEEIRYKLTEVLRTGRI
jgi:hypothetical protein